MPTYTTRRKMRFSPEQMYDLVADVDAYPQFLPLCESLNVTSRSKEADRTVLVATMGVGYKAIRERFTTRVTLFEDENKILVEYLDGPFRHLENRWRFLPAQGGCEVDFYISYEFRSRMLGLLMGAMFDKAFRKFADAFEARAGVIYGRRSAGGSPSKIGGPARA
ncbi:MAG: type II toxin-antitoxin system RatA family toxin [Pseudomonadota bacterium]